MKVMIYTKLDETTLAMDRKMEKQNDETKGEITLVRDEISAQFA